MTPRLQLLDITKAFGATRALRGVTLAVGPGESHALIGENGAGKSTLMKILSGAHRADSGSMELAGEPYRPRDPLRARRQGVVMIHQELTLAPHLTVAENITLGVEPDRAGWVDARRQRQLARQALERLRADHIPLDAPAGRLPIAQQQLVEIARTLRLHPQVLILDEPTSSLTRADTEHLFSVLDELRDEGVSLLYISHFLEESRRVCSRFTILRDGESVATGSLTGVSNGDLIRVMVGRDVGDLYPREPRSMGATVLEVRGLCGRVKPQDVDLTLRAGEVLGLFGLVGSGRTELLRALFGLDPVTAGEVLLDGVSDTHSDPHQRLSHGVGFLSENRKEEGLMLVRSVSDNLLATRFREVSARGFIREHAERYTALDWMQALEIRAQDCVQPVGELSGGNQQKVAFGRLICHQAHVLLLDEPTRGIDVGSKVTVYRRIAKAAAAGKAVIMASSYIPELLGVCDTIGVMCRGRLVAAKPRSDWTEESLLATAIGTD
jgi:ribose transport system ATP-binding protein